jgi:hypothetical protein
VPELHSLRITSLTRPSPVNAAGLRWPVDEQASGRAIPRWQGLFGLDQAQVRLYTAIARRTGLVMAAAAIRAITAALLRHRTSAQAPLPVRPGQPPPADPGMIALIVPEIARLLSRPAPAGLAGHRLDWRRRHRALARWHHHRTRLACRIQISRIRWPWLLPCQKQGALAAKRGDIAAQRRQPLLRVLRL